MGLQPGDILHDRYQIVELLGQGGFGRTYLVNDSKLNNRQCAIKEIPQPHDPTLLEKARLRFDREVSALSQLGQHPQIPQIFDRFEDDNHFYLVQEYIKGHPLSDELNSGDKWEEIRVVSMLWDILEVLRVVHKKQVIHRDIKPSNLIRKTDGKLVLIDFGAVREIGTLTVSHSGEIGTTTIGSPGYMPPEQQYGNPSFCSDIYAVGILGIQALTGVNPNKFLRDPDTCEIIWIYATPDRPMIQISDQLQEIINKMIRYDFRQRYHSATDILQDIAEIRKIREPESITKNHRNNPNFHGVILALGGCAIGLYAAMVLYKFITPKTCDIKTEDQISCGEEIIVSNLNPVPKQDGVTAFWRSKYQESLESFQKSWREDKKDPETLIYMNNALLEAIDADYYTIAISVPLRRNEAGKIVSDYLALEILRGVAQAQTEVNLSLLDSRGDNRSFPGRGILTNNHLNGKGLRVVIADDGNLVSQAQQVAKSLIKKSQILAVLGHYASDMTVKVVDLYNRNNLVLMSYGSTTNELTKYPYNFFFRTVGNTQNYAPILAQYLVQQGITKVVLCYNPSSAFAYSFQEDFKQKFLEPDGTATQREIVGGECDLTKKEVVEQVLSKLENQPDVAFVLSPDGEVTDSRANAIELFKANNDRHWIASSEGLNSFQTLEVASKLNSFEKLVISTHWHPINSQNSKFTKEVSQLWGGQVNTTTALTYDAARSLIEAIRQQPKPSRIGMQTTMRNPNFKVEGATGIIQFDPKTGDRLNPPQQLIHIVRCQSEQYGVTFVPIQFETAEAAGLKCDGDR